MSDAIVVRRPATRWSLGEVVPCRECWFEAVGRAVSDAQTRREDRIYAVVDSTKVSTNDLPHAHEVVVEYDREDGRGPVRESEARCDAHGGEDAARGYLATSWSLLAPVAVEDVLGAGCDSLNSEDAVVVVRREADATNPERYRVGIDSDDIDHLLTVADVERDARLAVLRAYALVHEPEPDRRPRGASMECAARDHAEQASAWLRAHGVEAEVRVLPARTMRRSRPWLAMLGLGSHVVAAGAYATRDEALEAGVEAWRKQVAASVERIRLARGGVLDWGIPVEPAERPIVVEPHEGESAWDAYATEEENT